MRKVLIVSYHAPPRAATTAYRIENLITNLPKFGWEPIVCKGTPANTKLLQILKVDQNSNLMAQLAQLKTKIGIYSEKSWVDRVAGIYGELFFYPDPMKGWITTNDAQLLFDKHKPDLVMSHSFPHTSHVVASRINRNRVPWIASFSDLWADSHFYPYSKLRRERERKFEEETLRGARCFITVSPNLSETIEMNHYRHAFSIPNSYRDVPDVPLTKDFTLTYTGNFYAGKYDIDLFCWALNNYRLKFPRLKVRFIGQPYPHLSKLIHGYHLDNMVSQIPSVPHDEALKAQKESQVLLHLVWNDPKSQGIYSAKLMEYLGAKRPIIAFGGADETVRTLLEQTGAGAWARTPDDFARILGEMYQEYMDNGAVQYHGNQSVVSQYSAEKMAERHADIFDRMAAKISA